jgi:hypothetical protein
MLGNNNVGPLIGRGAGRQESDHADTGGQCDGCLAELSAEDVLRHEFPSLLLR